MSLPGSGRTGPLLQYLRDHLPSLLLALVALVQMGLAWGGDRLNPDKGGGFGMFSTVDRLHHRQLRAYLLGPQGEERLPIPRDHSLRPTLHRATSFPSDQHLRAAAERLLPPERQGPARALRVEVWKHAFEPSSLQVRPLQMAALTLDLEGREAPPPPR
jgi:hypothetical protein